jgi:hypothetical protein
VLLHNFLPRREICIAVFRALWMLVPVTEAEQTVCFES